MSLTSRKGAQTHKAPISLLCGLCYSKGKLQLLIPAAEDNQCLVLLENSKLRVFQLEQYLYRTERKRQLCRKEKNEGVFLQERKEWRGFITSRRQWRTDCFLNSCSQCLQQFKEALSHSPWYEIWSSPRLSFVFIEVLPAPLSYAFAFGYIPRDWN